MNRTVMTAFLAMVVALGTLMVAGEGAAAKKPGTTAGAAPTIAINQSDPHLGDWVNFTISGIDVKSPRIQLMCYQDGVLTYGMALSAFDSFELGGGSSDWRTNGGEADCTATLYEWDWRPVQTFVPYASVSFHSGDRR